MMSLQPLRSQSLILLALAALILVSQAVTHFVGQGQTIAAESLKPCHLYGDSDNCGLGVRIGFYLQYPAALIAIGAGPRKELIAIRQGLIVVALGILISLCVNYFKDRLYMLDWLIVMPMILVPAVLTVFCPNPLRLCYQLLRLFTKLDETYPNSTLHAPLNGHDTRPLMPVPASSLDDTGISGSQWITERVKWAGVKMKAIKKAALEVESILGYGPIAIGIYLILCARYTFTQIKLFWYSVQDGRKTGCDIRTFIYIAPMSLTAVNCRAL